MKRLFIVHGWGGNPNEAWLPWLKTEMEKQGWQVFAPEMPETDEPKIEPWVARLKETVGELNEETYFVGHSIGCSTIMHYLENAPAYKKIGGFVFVAPWFNLPNLGTDEEKEIAKPWLETPINFEKVLSHGGSYVALFSDDDPDVPLSDKDLFAERLHTAIQVLHNKGHFSPDANVIELPEARDALLSF